MLKFEIQDQYKGAGISHGLDRGFLVSCGERLLLEEGMGIGACAVQTGGRTYFASVKSSRAAEGSGEVVYLVNKRLERQIAGIRSEFLARAIEFLCSNVYMRLEKYQSFLFVFAVWIRKIFRIEVLFVEVPPVAEINARYDFSENEVTVDLSCKTEMSGCTLYVMNELGANFFDMGLNNGKPALPPSGWRRHDGLSEFFSSTYKLAFQLVEKHVPDQIRSSIFWGRELSASHCWAGFESEISLDNGSFDHYIYSVVFREVTV